MEIKVKELREKIKRKKITPRILIGLVVIGVLSTIVFTQYRIRERIFGKPGLKEKAAVTKEGPVPQEPILVKVCKTQKKDFDDNLPLLGTVKGFKEIDLKFEGGGVVDSFNFKEGERIEEGEIIATINQKDALLKLKYNEIEFEKTQKLFDIGAIAKPKLEQTKLELESAKRELDKTYLYAPRSGVLGTKDVEVGELVTYSDKVATLIDDKEVFIEVGIVEKDIGKVKMGQRASVKVDTYPDTDFNGVVDNVSPVVEGRSRTQTAKIKVKNPKGLLLPGMFARATVAVYSAKGLIIIPNSAIDKAEEGYVTYVVKKAEEPVKKEPTEQEKSKRGWFSRRKEIKKEEAAEESGIEEQGAVEARPVEADYRSADFFVVKQGLEEEELVVIETQEKLKDGYKVIITETQEVAF
jgi:membrane fusion protein, multidrug efflux system